ncbi:hypothetical protein CEXT_418221 [Caerostris extrusa]|uniref:Ribosomal protein S10 n=1 Tax=Caerostris extrusa TaxID=172846 RepID=A0AAV4X069_CAEEX|nr:hypothetical protein CEXT_418221 [Caerostris extrusa]
MLMNTQRHSNRIKTSESDKEMAQRIKSFFGIKNGKSVWKIPQDKNIPFINLKRVRRSALSQLSVSNYLKREFFSVLNELLFQQRAVIFLFKTSSEQRFSRQNYHVSRFGFLVTYEMTR